MNNIYDYFFRYQLPSERCREHSQMNTYLIKKMLLERFRILCGPASTHVLMYGPRLVKCDDLCPTRHPKSAVGTYIYLFLVLQRKLLIRSRRQLPLKTWFSLWLQHNANNGQHYAVTCFILIFFVLYIFAANKCVSFLFSNK